MLHLEPPPQLLLPPSFGGVSGHFSIGGWWWWWYKEVVVAICAVYTKYWLVTFKKEKRKNSYLASQGGGDWGWVRWVMIGEASENSTLITWLVEGILNWLRQFMSLPPPRPPLPRPSPSRLNHHHLDMTTTPQHVQHIAAGACYDHHYRQQQMGLETHQCLEFLVCFFFHFFYCN